jgi:hypothetical protein
MTCYQYQTFVASSNYTLDTSLEVDVYWYGDLGGMVYGYIQIPVNTSCNSTSVYTGGSISCWGENLSYTSVTLNPSSYGSQIYQVGTTTTGACPC